MNIEDLKKITDMAIVNADKIIAFSKEKNDSSAILQAHGVLAFVNSLIMSESVNMVINEKYDEAEKTNEISALIDKKMNKIWERD